MDVLVVNNRNPIARLFFNHIHETVKIVPHDSKISIVIPGNKPTMPNSTNERTEINPIRNLIRLAQRIKLTEQLGTSKLEQPHAACGLGERAKEALLGILQRLAPPAVVFPREHLHVRIMRVKA